LKRRHFREEAPSYKVAPAAKKKRTPKRMRRLRRNQCDKGIGFTF
jgi:hypothetical protein